MLIDKMNGLVPPFSKVNVFLGKNWFLFAAMLGVLASLTFILPYLFLLLPVVWGTVLSSFLAMRERAGFFLTVFLFVFNLSSIWWIGLYSVSGMLYTVLYSLAVQSCPFLLMWVFKQKAAWCLSALFVVSSLSCEYMMIHFPLAWPWLLLGNSFATDVYMVQWYEFTGVLGGSMLVLAMSCVWAFAPYKVYVRTLIFFGLFGLSAAFSSSLGYGAEEKGEIKFALVQPNIDAYSQKFTAPIAEQFEKFYEMSLPYTGSADVIVWPETALHGDLVEHDLLRGVCPGFDSLKSVYANSVLIAGAETYSKQGHFNSALFLSKKDSFVYHKQKLVPLVEWLPLKNTLAAFGVRFSNTNDLYDTVQSVSFSWLGSNSDICPVLCFESAFGEYVAESARGRSVIAVLTNDGWWDGSYGNYQHLQLSKLRAIENRMPVARCANTGYSAFISARGDLISSSAVGQETVLCGTLPLAGVVTVYRKYGDYLGAYASFVLLLLILLLSLPVKMWLLFKKSE